MPTDVAQADQAEAIPHWGVAILGMLRFVRRWQTLALRADYEEERRASSEILEAEKLKDKVSDSLFCFHGGTLSQPSLGRGPLCQPPC